MMFNIGDKVWHVIAISYGDVTITCPLCAGNKSVTFILPNGDHEQLACPECESPYNGSTGIVHRLEAQSHIREVEITGVTRDRYEIEDNFEVLKQDNLLFATQEEAEARRAVLHAENVARCEAMKEARLVTAKKSAVWKMNYHRKITKDLRRQLEHHESKLKTLTKGEE